MFGLRKQVENRPLYIGGAVCNDQNLAGAGDHVDAYLSKNLFFCSRHVGIARAYDLIHARQRLRTIGESRYGLSAT